MKFYLIETSLCLQKDLATSKLDIVSSGKYQKIQQKLLTKIGFSLSGLLSPSENDCINKKMVKL